MKSRILLLTVLLAGGFFFLTSKSRWSLSELKRVVANEEPGGGGPLFREASEVRGAGLSNDELNNIEIYKRANLATVNITSTVYKQDWFMQNYPVKEAGSGFLISADGKIITNNHVISGSQQVEVAMANHETYKAQILARDPQNDLAILQIKPKAAVPFLTLGNSDALQVGQKVLAIGNPFRLEGTLTTGVVSALGRPLQSENRTLEGMIQTDAAINPGNSGGALVDINGSLLGINTAIYSRSGGNMGIGFAIPVSIAKQVLEGIVKDGQITRGWIGVEPNDLTPELAETFNVKTQQGVIITGVLQNGPAAQAGIRPGDVIVKIANQPVDNVAHLLSQVAALKPGTAARFTLERKNQPLELDVTPGVRPRPKTTDR